MYKHHYFFKHVCKEGESLPYPLSATNGKKCVFLTPSQYLKSGRTGRILTETREMRQEPRLLEIKPVFIQQFKTDGFYSIVIE